MGSGNEWNNGIGKQSIVKGRTEEEEDGNRRRTVISRKTGVEEGR